MHMNLLSRPVDYMAPSHFINMEEFLVFYGTSKAHFFKFLICLSSIMNYALLTCASILIASQY